METFYEIGRIAKLIKSFLAHSGHDFHIENNVDTVGKFDADFCEGRTKLTHGIGNNVHGSAFHCAVCKRTKTRIHFVFFDPVVGGTRHFFFGGADESSCFNPCNVILFCSVKKTSRKFFGVKFFHKAGGNGFRFKGFYLFFAFGYPNNFVGFNKGFHFFDPVKYVRVVGHCDSSFRKRHLMGFIIHRKKVFASFYF